MQVKLDNIVMVSHGQSFISKCIRNIQDFFKNLCFSFYSQCFPYCWIKERLKAEIYEKIKEDATWAGILYRLVKL